MLSRDVLLKGQDGLLTHAWTCRRCLTARQFSHPRVALPRQDGDTPGQRLRLVVTVYQLRHLAQARQPPLRIGNPAREVVDRLRCLSMLCGCLRTRRLQLRREFPWCLKQANHLGPGGGVELGGHDAVAAAATLLDALA